MSIRIGRISFSLCRNPHAPKTRADIRQWFCINEIPYGAFRSSAGQIHPWFHGRSFR